MHKVLIALLLATPAAAAPVLPDAAIEVKAAFICADGRAFEVTFRRPTQVAEVTDGSRKEVLYKTVTEKGYRYIAGENEFRGDDDKASYRVFPHPRVDCIAKPAVSVPGTVTGTITYRERIALPEGAVASVELRDISRADTAAPVVATTTITPFRNQVPLNWLMQFDPAKVEASDRYAVSAKISDKSGKLLWVSDTVTPALTRGAPVDFINVNLVAAK